MWPYGTDVDPRIVRLTQATPWLSTFGQVTAPAAGALIADTGNLDLNPYFFQFCLCVSDTVTVGKRIDLQWRNDIDTVTVQILASTPAATSLYGMTGAKNLTVNQSVRAVAGVAGAASSVYTASITVWLVP